MAQYQVSTLGEYTKLLYEDTMHALRYEERVVNDDGESTWFKNPNLQVEPQVEANVREIIHHMRSILASANAMDVLFKQDEVEPGFWQRYEQARMEYVNKWADDWAWLDQPAG